MIYKRMNEGAEAPFFMDDIYVKPIIESITPKK